MELTFNFVFRLLSLSVFALLHHRRVVDNDDKQLSRYPLKIPQNLGFVLFLPATKPYNVSEKMEHFNR
jgi:hypothetical protein